MKGRGPRFQGGTGEMKRKEREKYRDWTAITAFRGCRFYAGLDNKIEKRLRDDGEDYDRSNFELIVRLIKPGQVCLDAGANIGVYSVVLASLCGGGDLVHSFEPVAHIRAKLHANLRLNGFRDINVNACALGASAAELPMYQVKEGQFRGGVSSLVKTENYEALGADAYEVVKVAVKALDEYVAEKGLERVDFMKIDVEGFELDVLEGAVRVMREMSPHILFEHDPGRMKTRRGDFGGFFAEHGYRVHEFKHVSGGVMLREYKFEGDPVKRNLFAIPVIS